MRDNGYFADGTQFRIVQRSGRWVVMTYEFDNSPSVIAFSGNYEDCLAYANAPERNAVEPW